MNAKPALAAVALVIGTITLLVACTSNPKNPESADSATGPSQPEIVKTSGGSVAETAGGKAADIIKAQAGTGFASGSVASPQLASALGPVPGLTVSFTQSATVAADQAFVVAYIAPRGGFTGTPQPIAAKDQAAIIAALAALGIRKEDISFDSNYQYGPFATVRVGVAVGDLKGSGQKILDAIESAAGRPESSGAEFGLKACDLALAPIRKDAFRGAGERARSLAAAASLTPGKVVAISETQGPNTIGMPVQDPCSPAASYGPKTGGGMLAFDAIPEVKVSLTVGVTYALGDGAADGAGVTVTGIGSATARADTAYVVVLGEAAYGPTGPRPLATKTRNEIIQSLVALGIKNDDIHVESSGYGSPVIVSARVDLVALPKIGKDVANAVTETLGRVQNQGVRFTHSNCQAVVGEARKQAIADSKRRIEALAGAAGLKLGDLHAISEGTALPVGYPAAPDPCGDDLASLVYGGPYAAGFKGFDADQEFTVEAALTVTYAIK